MGKPGLCDDEGWLYLLFRLLISMSKPIKRTKGLHKTLNSISGSNIAYVIGDLSASISMRCIHIYRHHTKCIRRKKRLVDVMQKNDGIINDQRDYLGLGLNISFEILNIPSTLRIHNTSKICQKRAVAFIEMYFVLQIPTYTYILFFCNNNFEGVK